jgi:hypothetical protein
LDPITAAVVAALAAGIAKATSENVISDAYKALKDVLKRKFGGKSDVVKAVNDLETNPDSVERQQTLQEAVSAAKADQDPEVVAAAERLQVAASGERAVAAGRDARDIAYDRGRVVRTEVGGNVSGSSITTAGGDVVGAAPAASSTGELYVHFEPILMQVRARPSDPDVETIEILQTVESIRDEAALGQAANPSKIERWVRNLTDMAPDVKDAVVETLQKPVGSVSQQVRQAAVQAGQ